MTHLPWIKFWVYVSTYRDNPEALEKAFQGLKLHIALKLAGFISSRLEHKDIDSWMDFAEGELQIAYKLAFCDDLETFSRIRRRFEDRLRKDRELTVGALLELGLLRDLVGGG